MALLKAEGHLSRPFPLKFSLRCDLFLHFSHPQSLSSHVLLHCSNETFVHALWVNFAIQQLWVHQYPRLFYWDYNLIEVFRLWSKDFIENRNIFQLFSTHPHLVCYCHDYSKIFINALAYLHSQNFKISQRLTNSALHLELPSNFFFKS